MPCRKNLITKRNNYHLYSEFFLLMALLSCSSTISDIISEETNTVNRIFDFFPLIGLIGAFHYYHKAKQYPQFEHQSEDGTQIDQNNEPFYLVGSSKPLNYKTYVTNFLGDQYKPIIGIIAMAITGTYYATQSINAERFACTEGILAVIELLLIGSYCAYKDKAHVTGDIYVPMAAGKSNLELFQNYVDSMKVGHTVEDGSERIHINLTHSYGGL